MGHSKIGLGTNKNNIADTKMHESLSKVKTIGTTSFHARPSLIVSLGPSINDVTQLGGREICQKVMLLHKPI